jgi:hypothetical protein
MSGLYDMISAFIALLMSAAFLHFGAAGESRPAPASHAMASSAAADPVVDARDDAVPTREIQPLPPRRHCHGHASGQPTLDTIRAPSPLRRG